MCSIVDVNQIRIRQATYARKLSAIKSNKRFALLTTGTILLLLGVAAPAAYGATQLLDPKVTGNGSGTITCAGGGDACVPCGGLFDGGTTATITFDGAGGITAGHGTWTITMVGFNPGATASGPITSVSTNKVTFSLTGNFNPQGACGPGVLVPISITGNCGTSATITFTATGPTPLFASGSFSGTVTCKGK